MIPEAALLVTILVVVLAIKLNNEGGEDPPSPPEKKCTAQEIKEQALRSVFPVPENEFEAIQENVYWGLIGKVYFSSDGEVQMLGGSHTNSKDFTVPCECYKSGCSGRAVVPSDHLTFQNEQNPIQVKKPNTISYFLKKDEKNK